MADNICFGVKSLVILLLSFPLATSGINWGDCVGPLGMESEQIADDQISSSSSYDAASVGPQNARLGHEDGGGAWCPRQQIKKDVYEYLEINLQSLHVISTVETQGRFGNGQGQEYAEHFILEYKRDDNTSEWSVYKNRRGDKLIRGNTNTYVRNNQVLDPPIIASRVRFVPQSVYARTVCMRVEVFGCPWSDGVQWYSMPQGESRGPDVQLMDWTYDGVVHNNHLYMGLGQLTDGRYGLDNFRPAENANGNQQQRALSDWVGWKNETHRGQIDLTFKFDQPRRLTAMYIYCNNLFSKEVQVFASAAVYTSIGGKYYTGQPIKFTYTPDTVVEKARNVSIKLENRIGKYVKVILRFASKWMMISEVSFESEPLQGNFTPEVSPPELHPKSTTSSPALDGQFFHIFHPSGILLGSRNWPEVQQPSQRATQRPAMSSADDYVGLIIGVVSGVVVLALICVAIVLLRFRHRKHHYHSKFHSDFFSLEKNLPFDFRHHCPVETLRSNNGNLYGSVALEDEDRNTIYHEPHQVILKRPAGGVATLEIQQYHNSLCSRDYAVPEIRSPLTKPRIGTNCRNAASDLQGPSGTHSMSSGKSTVITELEPFVPPEIPRESLKFIEKIGEGQFGEVHLCAAEDIIGFRTTSPSPVKLVAVKILRNDVSDDIKTDFKREIDILSTLHDPNLIQVIGICTKDDPLSMVVEYMECGDLNQFLKDHTAEGSVAKHMRQKTLSYGTLVHMAVQIASGMKYLESLNYVHRDLATRNCLVGSSYSIKISDFGMSRRLYADDYYRLEGKAILPIRWMAWESILFGKFTTRTDVWAFAVTFWEILTFARQQPFEDLSDDMVIENAGMYYSGAGNPVELPQPLICPKEIYDLMRECWQRHEDDRPNFREIHLFLQRKNLGFSLPEPDC